MFEKFYPTSGKKGYYLETDLIRKRFSADSTYAGDVFVLVNERSFSASAVFAGLVKKYQRGTIIGRETASAYYQMNAIKFATLRLPNSKIKIRIPLVKEVFDTVPIPDIPWGRGVIPDYSVSLTMEELAWENDTILSFALNHIRANIQSTDNQVDKERTPIAPENQIDDIDLNVEITLIWVAFICLGLLLILYLKNRIKNHTSNNKKH